jgi:hypothetical protein
VPEAAAILARLDAIMAELAQVEGSYSEYRQPRFRTIQV